MACPEFEDRLLAYDELGGAERRSTDAHLATCPACRDFHEALREIDRALHRAFAGVRPGEAFDDSVLTAARRLRRLDGPSVVPVFLDFVASAAIVLVGVLLLNNGAVLFQRLH